MLKKFLLSASVIIIFAIYAIRVHTPEREIAPVVIPSNAPQPTQAATSAPPLPVSSGTTPPVMVGKYKDGTYTGSVADAFYGNVQVQAIISGGRLVDVKWLQYPNDRQTSIEINSQAMPLLTQEAIQAQSAQVDGVSGASATSPAFIQSLGSALQQAM